MATQQADATGSASDSVLDLLFEADGILKVDKQRAPDNSTTMPALTLVLILLNI